MYLNKIFQLNIADILYYYISRVQFLNFWYHVFTVCYFMFMLLFACLYFILYMALTLFTHVLLFVLFFSLRVCHVLNIYY